MTDEEKLAMVAALYTASGSGDFDTAETMLTEDFFIREAQGLPMAGEYHGRTALRNLYAQVFGTLKVADLEQECITAGGDCVVNLISFRFVDEHLPRAELAELFRFRDGKVCEIRPYYFDPQPIMQAWEYYSSSKDN